MLAEQAVRAVVAAGYENLGTLEFLVDQDGQPLLHRDQLPHPGGAPRDRDALGHRPRRGADPDRGRGALGYIQADVQLRGHAIEFRINAEDVRHDFRPSAGTVERYLAPGGPGVRMDSHMYGGYEVPPYYNSLLGKLVVWGEDRTAAIQRARVALAELVVDGVVTNIDLHRALMDSRPFLDGAFTTNLIDRVGSAAFLPPAG